MPGEREDRISQRARGGRDVYMAGRDQTVITGGDHMVVNVGAGAAVPEELGMPGLLPRDVPAFTGRDDELARLARLTGGGRVVVSAIGGTAGVGKTALAVHAAHQLLDQFPDGHLYADLRGYTEGQGPAGPGEVLQVFLRRLGVPANEVPAGVEERSGLLRQVLAGRRVLMVLDNASTEKQVRPLLPGAGGSLVLVTSRSVLPGLEADERISLDTLAPDEAAAMLARVTGAARAQAEPQAVEEVARLCGRLPLALRIAGQLLATHPAWTMARLAQLLTREQDRLARLGAGDLRVQAAFEVSYAQLGEGDARLFRLLGLHPGPDFTADSAAALAGTEAAGPVLDRLAGVHLVTSDAAGRFGMHDLLRLYARGTCQQTDSQSDREAAETRIVGYYTELAWFLNSCVDPRQGPPEELASMREALGTFQAERPGLLAALGLAAQRGWDEQVQQLGRAAMGSLRVLRYLDDLLTVCEAALAAARRAGDRADEGRAENALADAYQLLRRFDEAVDCCQRSLAIFRETGDQYGEGQVLGNLGVAYQELRRFEEALYCFQQAMAIFGETGDRHGEGRALIGLGEACRELRRFDEAIDRYQEARAILGETGDRHGEGRALIGLGEACTGLRRLKQAADWYRKALAVCRETGDRHGESMALNGLGATYAELRRFKKAADCYQREIAICRETGDRRTEGRVLTNLGNTYQQLRRFEEAIDWYRKALAVCRETGDRHGEGLTLTNLGIAYQGLRRFTEAFDRFQQALATFGETGDRLGEGLTLADLGLAYQELGHHGRAAECWREAAAAMRDAGDHEQAGRLEQQAVSTQSQGRWGLRRGP